MSKVLRIITAEELAAKIKTDSEIVVLDVRTEEEWATGHLTQALLFPMHQIVRRIGELNPKQETIVVCQRGFRSNAVAQYLVAVKNFENVSTLCGGMNAWQGEVVTSPPAHNVFDCSSN